MSNISSLKKIIISFALIGAESSYIFAAHIPVTASSASKSLNDAPIHNACKTGKLKEIIVLLASGTDVNQLGKKNYTPLHYACNTDNHKVVQLLTQRGGNIYAQGIDGSTPVSIAYSRKNEAIKSIIKAIEQATSGSTEIQSRFKSVCSTTMPIRDMQLEEEKHAEGGGAAAIDDLERPESLTESKRLNVEKPDIFFDVEDDAASGARGSEIATYSPISPLQMKYEISGKELDANAIQEIEQKIGYVFKNKNLLIKSLTTRDKNSEQNYEVYEFLGDAILDAIICEMLLLRYSKENESSFTSMRTALVRQEPMAALCAYLGLYKYIQHIESHVPISTLCDIIEAIIAAIYKDGGPEAAQNFVLKFFQPMLREECPISMHKIIQDAAQKLKQDIVYHWDGTTCYITTSPGSGAVNIPLSLDGKYMDKNSPKRLAKFLSQKAFIEEDLPIDYRKHLVRLATDIDYMPLDKIPAFNLSWNEEMPLNFRSNLNILMGKLVSRVPDYSNTTPISDGFECRLTIDYCKPVIGYGRTKTKAQEDAAQKAYKAIQKFLILSADLEYSADDIDGDEDNSIEVLNSFCRKHKLFVPQYVEYYKGKNGRSIPCKYAHIQAPWLFAEIKGSSETKGRVSQLSVARKVISLIRYLATGYAKPQLLYTINELKKTDTNKTGMLIHLCRCLNLEDGLSIKDSYICEGKVSKGLQFETEITITDEKFGRKRIIGKRYSSKTKSQESAASIALNYLLNKMLKVMLPAN